MSRTTLLAIGAGIGIASGLLLVRAGGLPPLSELTFSWSKPTPDWPPVVGDLYPDWRLSDTDGNMVQLSSYRGKVTLVELVGVPCKGCQAFSGGHQYGPFAGVKPQAGLKSLAEYFPRFAGRPLADPAIQFIQILLYDSTARKPPGLSEAKRWEQHFRMHTKGNAKVLIGDRRMQKKTAISMIPGFHLIDKEFRLRVVAGKPAQSDLYTGLLAKIPELIE